jgi:hypothetical protein
MPPEPAKPCPDLRDVCFLQSENVCPSATGRCWGRMLRRTRSPPRSGTRIAETIHTSWCEWPGPPNDLREKRTRGKLTHEWGREEGADHLNTIVFHPSIQAHASPCPAECATKCCTFDTVHLSPKGASEWQWIIHMVLGGWRARGRRRTEKHKRYIVYLDVRAYF